MYQSIISLLASPSIKIFDVALTGVLYKNLYELNYKNYSPMETVAELYVLNVSILLKLTTELVFIYGRC